MVSCHVYSQQISLAPALHMCAAHKQQRRNIQEPERLFCLSLFQKLADVDINEHMHDGGDGSFEANPISLIPPPFFFKIKMKIF